MINYFFFVAEEMRQLMAKLRFRTIEEMVGQSDKLHMRAAIYHWKAKGLDYSKLLTKPIAGSHADEHHTMGQEHGIELALDNELIRQAKPALNHGEKVTIDIDIHNHNRTLGTMLSGGLRRSADIRTSTIMRVNAKRTRHSPYFLEPGRLRVSP